MSYVWIQEDRTEAEYLQFQEGQKERSKGTFLLRSEFGLRMLRLGSVGWLDLIRFSMPRKS